MGARKRRGPAGPATKGVTDFVRLGIDRLLRPADLSAGFAQVTPRLFGTPLRRPDDLFVGTLYRDNLVVVRGDEPTLVRSDPAQPARLILELPPQSFGEEALLAPTAPEAPVNPPASEAYSPPSKRTEATNVTDAVSTMPGVRMRMAGPSRLVFLMPADVASVPYTFAGILEACRTWPMARALSARPPAPPRGLRFAHDADFLLTMLSSAEFAQARATTSAALVSMGGADLDRLAQNAAVRLSRRAMEFTANGVQPGTDTLMTESFRSELDGVAARMPTARDPKIRAVLGVAIGQYTTAALAEFSRARPEVDISDVFPILPWIIRPQPVPWNATQIELPYRLVISPVGTARFEHDTTARRKRQRHELWHTHVTASDARTGPDAPTAFRAIWSDDYALDPATLADVTNNLKPYRMPMDAMDRSMLVSLMAGFHLQANGVRPVRFQPVPSTAQRLHLSSLGGLLDSEGNWNVRPAGVDVQQWKHIATLGRDHYVRVVYAGYLLPFGHAASLVKVTERKFEPARNVDGATPGANRVAVLRQRFFIAVREQVKEYNGERHATQGRPFPFRSVEILTRLTPNLTAPTEDVTRVFEVPGRPVISTGIAKRMLFWPMTGTGAAATDFRFELAGTDGTGQRSTFSLPLVFVGEVPNQQPTTINDILAGYAATAEARRTADLRGASVAFAPFDPAAQGDTRLPTKNLVFTTSPVTFDRTKANVYPEMDAADVGIRAVQRLLGRENAVKRVKYEQAYRDNGFAPVGNAGEVFLRLVDKLDLGFGDGSSGARTDSIGGLVAPSFAIEGLSRVMGPASDIAKIIGTGGGTVPTFDPTTFFKGATLLGGIKLETILEVVSGLAGKDVPKLVSREVLDAGGVPTSVEARFDWETRLTKPDPTNVFVPGTGGAATMLTMHGLMSAPVNDPDAATFEALAAVNDFKLNLFGFIILSFKSLRFDVKRGQKPDVAVDFVPGENAVRFGGPLEFVNELKKYIPANGFSDPPSLSVTPSGITASYSLNVPNLQVGIFALSNLSIGAGFSLPFDAKPVQVNFNFCTRERPFSLTVSLLGGGGFFAIGIGASGVREIEAAVEFGAALSIDLGVASGSVEIKAGVYFHWAAGAGGKGGVVQLTGYVRLHGELDVLGLISASLTFNLQLSYLKQGSKSTVWGEATLTITIDILFFSADVSVQCRREFGGSPSDPTFLDLVPDESNWQDYCLAYGED